MYASRDQDRLALGAIEMRDKAQPSPQITKIEEIKPREGGKCSCHHCAHLEQGHEGRSTHTSYLQHWCRSLGAGAGPGAGAVGAPRGAYIQSLKGGDMGQDPGDGRKLPQPPDPSRWVIGLVLGSVESCKKQQFVSLRHRCQLRGLALGWRGGVR